MRLSQKIHDKRILLGILLVAILVGTVQVEAIANTLDNGSFESNFGSSSSNNWEAYHVEQRYNPSTAVSGNYFAVFTSVGYILQTVSYTNAEFGSLKFYAMPSGLLDAIQLSVVLGYKDSAGVSHTYTRDFPQVQVGFDWDLYTVGLPSGAVQITSIKIKNRSTSSLQPFYVDAVSISAPTPPPNECFEYNGILYC